MEPEWRQDSYTEILRDNSGGVRSQRSGDPERPLNKTKCLEKPKLEIGR